MADPPRDLEKGPPPQVLAIEAASDHASDNAAAKSELSAAPPVPYWKLYSTADWLDWLLVVLGVVGALANGCMLPLFSILFGNFTDAFGKYIPPCYGIAVPGYKTTEQFMADVSEISLKFLYVAIGATVAGYLQQACWSYTSVRQANRMRRLFLEAVLKQDIAFFDTQATTGGLLQGLNEDSLAIQQAMSDKMGVFLQHMSTFIVGYVIAFWRGWEVTLVMVGCLPFLAGAGALLAKVTTTLGNKSQEAYTTAGSVVQQALAQIRTVTAYNGQQRALQEYQVKLDGPTTVSERVSLFGGASLGFMQFVMFCSYAVALFFGAYRIAAGAYTGGYVINVIFAALIGSFSIGMAAPNLQYFSKGQAAAGRMFAIINRKPAIDSSSEEGQKPERLEGRIELQGVSFSYPARPDVQVFKDFNLVVPAGKTVALVGSSGSGKSTIIGLLERYYDPCAGRVLLDGVDLKQLNLGWLRGNVGLVSQEPTLFANSIYENIAIGREGATRKEVEEAAKAANAWTFINAMPDKFETKVGERGVQLSGGQKQRIAIARAILKNPKVLLLDEATSALDSESERVVQDALDRMVVGRTTVVVAHRLSTIQGADIIAVVRAGQLVEQGTHQQLLQDPAGAYTTLVKLQMQHQEEEEAMEMEQEEVLAAGGRPLTRQSLERVDSKRRSGSLDLAGRAGGPLQQQGSGSMGASQRASRHQTVEEALAAEAAAAAAAAAAAQAEQEGALRNIKIDKQASIGSGGLPAIPDEASDLGGAASPGAATSKTLTAAEQEAAEKAEAEAAAANVPFSRLLGLNRPEWGYGLLGSAASTLVGSVQPLFAFIFAGMISIFYLTDMEQLKRDAGRYAGYFFALACGIFSAVMVQQWSFGVMGHRLARRIRTMMFKGILRQDIGWFDLDANSSGKLASNLATDASYIRGAVGDVAGLGFQNLATMIVGYVIAMIYDWRMALVVTGVAPLIAVGGYLNLKYTVGFSEGADKLYSEANQSVSEAVASIRVIQAYCLERYVAGLYRRTLHGTNVQGRKTAMIGGAGFAYSMFTMFGMYSLVVWFGGLEVTSCRATFQQFLTAFMCILFVALGLGQAQVGFPDIAKAKGAVGRVFRVVDRTPPIDSEAEGGLAPPEGCKGHLELQHVVFAYPSRPSVRVFNNFCLDIPAGKTVALVGESGSGKSTVVGLVERYYDPLSGRVLLDGVELKQYNLRWLRSQMALVSQEPLLFGTSVLDNIRYGAPEATLEQVRAAAAAANALEFIDKLPEGLETQVGERGVQLSGGQKQRIAIARAVVKDPKILLLDEATSALDASSERLVQDALDKLMVGRTSVVVAHRLSTIKGADIIAVVYRGVLLEQGTHEELLAVQGGGYARLVAAQMKGGGGGGGANLF